MTARRRPCRPRRANSRRCTRAWCACVGDLLRLQRSRLTWDGFTGRAVLRATIRGRRNAIVVDAFPGTAASATGARAKAENLGEPTPRGALHASGPASAGRPPRRSGCQVKVARPSVGEPGLPSTGQAPSIQVGNVLGEQPSPHLHQGRERNGDGTGRGIHVGPRLGRRVHADAVSTSTGSSAVRSITCATGQPSVIKPLVPQVRRSRAASGELTLRTLLLVCQA